MLFEADSYSFTFKYHEWVIFPIETHKTYKDIVAIIKTYEARRLGKKYQKSAVSRYGYSFSGGSQSLIDVKVFDNLPSDPSYTKWSVKCEFCHAVHYNMSHCAANILEETTLAKMMEKAGKRELKLVAQFKRFITREEIRDFKDTTSVPNPEIMSKQVQLRDCIAGFLKPEQLESFKC